MRSKFFFLVTAAFFCCFNFYGQSKTENGAQDNLTGESDDIRSENAGANEIRQPFAWTSAGDVLKYQVIIDRINSDGSAEQVFFHETDEEETEACKIYIEPVLPPGHYRSQIRVFNILGIEEEDLLDTDFFDIRKAYMPEIKNVTYPLYMRSTIYLDDLDNDGIIKIEGHNLFDLPVTYDELIYTEYFLKNDKRRISPVEIIDRGKNDKNLTFRFDMKKLPVGEYYFIAQDASGLHSEENSDSHFSIKFKKWMDFDVEGGYVCPVVLHDDTFPSYIGKVLPFSVQGKVSFMPLKNNWGYLGFGIRASYSRLYKDCGDYTIDGNLATGHFIVIYQLPMFRHRVVAELHGGAGLSYFNDICFHFAHNVDSEPLNTVSISLDAGASLQFYLNKRLYTEIAADYVFTMNSDMILGMILPSAGVGWQF
ncbi:hypothetical protein [Treponema sp.]|uniref:hypothetical protein n=1 Tax=Treponema sp. TaxID=166 RepID=UPI0025811306|nr:hypothetical protein [Treponema sp.]MBE6354908.1 hypothetical protein [Treponema sp.]